MRLVKWMVVVVFMVYGQAPGQEPATVSFTLELGGNNSGATCIGDQPSFTPGNPADDVTYIRTQPLTWDVKIAATGSHMVMWGEPPVPEYFPIRGVAGFWFVLKLYKDAVVPGNEVTGADFYSSTNDGDAGCPLASAAFAYSWATNGMPAWTPGRVFEAYKVTRGSWGPPIVPHNTGGPWMELHTYPIDNDDGMLLGMGAAYAQWKRVSNAEWSTAGVGQVDPQLCDPSLAIGCLGLGPACEGQINVSTLANGTYILVLEPGAGINVLRGDLDKTGQSDCTPANPVLCDGLDQTRALDGAIVPADETVGDQITFLLYGWPPPIHWWSVRTHAPPCGELAIPLNHAATSGATVTSETRRGGLQKIVVDFNADVHLAHTPGQISIVGGGGLSVQSESFINGGETLVITFTGSMDGTCPTISLANSFSGWVAGADKDCRVRILCGDINNDQCTNLTDMALAKHEATRVPRITPLERPELDVNLDCRIDLTDMALIKSLAVSMPAHCAYCN